MGGRIQALPSGKIRIIFFKWQYFLISIFFTSFSLFILYNQLISTFSIFKWSKIDQNDEEFIFLPFTSRKVSAKFKSYIHNQPSSLTHHPKFYYPRNCPHLYQPQKESCAKPVPSFIFAGSEYSGSSFIFETLKQHPQVYASIDNSHLTKSVFNTEEFDETNAFDKYISQFPFLINEEISDSKIVGENAPHYLYQSHLTAKRIKNVLPHVKLVFFLREPIARAYSQYLHEKPELRDTKLSFESLIDLELPILRRCGHTSTQTGWEGFVRCHQGSEIRASWKASNDSHSFNALAKGMYYSALIPFFQQFPSSQIFVMKSEDVMLHPSKSFQNLAKFLDIDPDYFLNVQPITEEELFSNNNIKPNKPISPTIASHFNHHYHNQKIHHITANSQPYSILKINEPELSTRYRLQKVYRHINNRLVELFDHSLTTFHSWIYDVDRG